MKFISGMLIGSLKYVMVVVYNEKDTTISHAIVWWKTSAAVVHYNKGSLGLFLHFNLVCFFLCKKKFVFPFVMKNESRITTIPLPSPPPFLYKAQEDNREITLAISAHSNYVTLAEMQVSPCCSSRQNKKCADWRNTFNRT